MTLDAPMALGRAATAADLTLEVCLCTARPEVQEPEVAVVSCLATLTGDSHPRERYSRTVRARKWPHPGGPGPHPRFRMHLVPVPRA